MIVQLLYTTATPSTCIKPSPDCENLKLLLLLLGLHYSSKRGVKRIEVPFSSAELKRHSRFFFFDCMGLHCDTSDSVSQSSACHLR